MWNSLAPIYTTFDASMQAFYYTLASMMKIPEAKHIYEVGCGIGKMIPYTLSLKNEECTYLATDLSEKMVEMSRNYLASYTYKLGLQDNFDKWMERQRLEMGVHDGECMFKPAHKFDRIICNLVLMNTADAHKMMQAMHEVADEKCLLGVSVWGDKKSSNFLNLPM
jgi:ubiquinone/menaquinone biosynthesis C-methylase UbiE